MLGGNHLQNDQKYRAGGQEHTYYNHYIGAPARKCEPQPPRKPFAVEVWR